MLPLKAPDMMLGSVLQTQHLREVVELREVVTTSLEEVVAVEETVLVGVVVVDDLPTIVLTMDHPMVGAGI
jgi:hypothetical protein